MFHPKTTEIAGGSGIKHIHLLVIALSMLVTVGAWQFSIEQVETRADARFQAARDNAVALIRDRMSKYEDALWSGVATMRSHQGHMSHDKWLRFATSLNIQDKYPGINGIGVIHYQDPQTLGTYLQDQRQTRPDFAIRPAHDQPFYLPITYIEPVDINAAAVGLDVAHEKNRRTAALASRDTGTSQITGPIVLVQDENHTAGFLFYAPFYTGDTPRTLQDRQDQFRGAVYAPFVVHKLMEGVLSKEARLVRFSIYDDGQRIYDEHDQPGPGADPDPMYSQEVKIDLYGREWTLDMRTNMAFRQGNTYAQPTFILVAGLIVEALIILMLVLLSRANRRAVTYAGEVTAELRTEKEKLNQLNDELSRKNEELEQFTYVASHDLKTPIRGIGGLTEMIEEDLEDYFASPSANPDVRENLKHIHERVRHMTDLTRGIMQYSQVDIQPQHSPPISIVDLIAHLRRDFGLTAEQLIVTGDPIEIEIDTSNFRRVLENLISNAVKYHDGKKPIRIELSTKDMGSTCRVCVSDNGPGIAPKFHKRIFDVFQSLKIPGASESTGIGLAIVKKAVGRHNGEVDVDSSLGNGARFSFNWPLIAEKGTINDAA